MATKWAVDFKEKELAVVANHPNILEEPRKKHKNLMDIKAFPVYVEVLFESALPSTQGVIDAAQEAAEGVQRLAVDAVEDLVKAVRDLQKEEKQGNNKAADTATKQVEKVEKALKKLADEFGWGIRKAVQSALTGAYKQKLKSASRVAFRGLELSPDAFEGQAEAEVPAYAGELAKSLAALGKEAFKLATQEKDSRRELTLDIDRVQGLVDKEANGKEIDLKEFLKGNTKDGRALEVAAGKYSEFLTTFKEKLDEAKEHWTKIDKLVDRNMRAADKELGTLLAAFEKARAIVAGTLPDKLSAAEQAKKLFKEPYNGGKGWKALSSELAGMPGAAKSGKEMQEKGAALEKKLKG